MLPSGVDEVSICTILAIQSECMMNGHGNHPYVSLKLLQDLHAHVVTHIHQERNNYCSQ